MPLHYVCHLNELQDPESRGFTLSINGQIHDFFVIKKSGHIHGYKNTCPHLGAPLNWQAHAFLNTDKSKIQCAMHGAQFIIETGECIYGPCIGGQLAKVDLTVKNGEIYLRVTR